MFGTPSRGTAGPRSKASDLLVDGHQREQVVDSLFSRQRWIVERISRLLRKCRSKPQNHEAKEGRQVSLHCRRLPYKSIYLRHLAMAGLT